MDWLLNLLKIHCDISDPDLLTSTPSKTRIDPFQPGKHQLTPDSWSSNQSKAKRFAPGKKNTGTGYMYSNSYSFLGYGYNV